jgi:hypothetical protein
MPMFIRPWQIADQLSGRWTETVARLPGRGLRENHQKAARRCRHRDGVRPRRHPGAFLSRPEGRRCSGPGWRGGAFSTQRIRRLRPDGIPQTGTIDVVFGLHAQALGIATA